ncbi:30S ribosomal protein S4 [Patescibacteria group bacterium]
MARDLKAKCRQCRRAGEKLFLKGDRCSSPKCGMVKKNYAPGMHGKKMTRGLSEYGRQLAMKQRIKRIYGVLERQFRNHFDEASKKQGVAGDLLMVRLEMRLDNVVYRMGFAPSRTTARQIVNHGLINVNGKKVSIPSYKAKPGDVVSARENKKEKPYFQEVLRALKNKKGACAWVQVDAAKLEGKILSLPEGGEISSNVDPQLVVEYYSR